ncbi:LysR family transcriptional regulator [Acinetobacter qingfengensis]|uniref:LysR family transcriptional regulator n=1 Tax=Acinetobacter qingfengensis TaxID=1262585 RepID=A0A1E7R325_9GAMM|nr:LysR family transcriptional regulator [Acinetobacter qingfengensis]KAA8731482.1 LysR family transcriptional regulator [Acinetobacter qingfengensis]OEY93769.1 LysR family transcriptional regulator [Acinetobacter qingfengensis]
MDRFSCMQVFVKTVELGSISAAAIELDISSQVAGKQIKSLEQLLEIKLLHRTTRQQSLTDAGRIFYEKAKYILAEMEEAENFLAEIKSTPRGKLRISAPVTFGNHVLSLVIVEFLKKYPEVNVELILTNRKVDLIEEGYDIVFRSGDLQDSGLISRLLVPYKLVLCASPEYIKFNKKLANPEDLKNHECLVFTHSALKTQWSFKKNNQITSVLISGKYWTNSGEALRIAAIAGQGILLQPYQLVSDDLNSGRLIRILPEYEPINSSMHILYSRDRRMPPKLKSFIDFILIKFGI